MAREFNTNKAAQEWAKLVKELGNSPNASSVEDAAERLTKLLEASVLIQDDRERADTVIALRKIRTKLRLQSAKAETERVSGVDLKKLEALEKELELAKKEARELEGKFLLNRDKNSADFARNVQAQLKAFRDLAKDKGSAASNAQFRKELIKALASFKKGDFQTGREIYESLPSINKNLARDLQSIEASPTAFSRLQYYMKSKVAGMGRGLSSAKESAKEFARSPFAYVGEKAKSGAKSAYEYAKEKLAPTGFLKAAFEKEEAFRKGLTGLLSKQVRALQNLPRSFDSWKAIGIGALIASVLGALPSWDQIKEDILNSGPIKYVKKAYDWIAEKLAPVGEFISETWGWLKTTAQSGWSMVKDAFSDIVSFGKASWNYMTEIGAYFRNKIDTMIETVKSYFNLDKPDKEKGPVDLLFSTGYKALFGSAPAVPAENMDRMDRLNARNSRGLVDEVGSAQRTSSNFLGGVATNVQNWIGKYLTTRASANLSDLDPNVRDRFFAMAEEYTLRTGKRLVVNSGYRSFGDQVRLYRKDPTKAARPGTSLHEKGLAIDVDSAGANDLDRLGLLRQFGFERPMANEAWHLQTLGAKEQARRMGYSNGDGPANTKPASQNFESPSSGGAGEESSSGSQPQSSIGRSTVQETVGTVPTHAYSDPSFFAMNLGVISP